MVDARIKITSVTRKVEPDLDNQGMLESDYGKFTNHWESGVLRTNLPVAPYFKSSTSDWVKLDGWERITDEEKAKVIAEYGSLKKAVFHYAQQDLKRAIAWYKGTWEFIGIVYDATLAIEINGKTFIAHEYESLWGLESDDPDLDTPDAAILIELKASLRKIGFTDEELNFSVVKL